MENTEQRNDPLIECMTEFEEWEQNGCIKAGEIIRNSDNKTG